MTGQCVIHRRLTGGPIGGRPGVTSSIDQSEVRPIDSDRSADHGTTAKWHAGFTKQAHPMEKVRLSGNEGSARGRNRSQPDERNNQWLRSV